jgi:hypothetical protein
MMRGKESALVATIVMRDGHWYVEQENSRAKYRPYEAPLGLPACYLFLTTSDPTFLIESDGFESLFSQWDGKTAVYRSDLPASLRLQLQSVIDSVAKFNKDKIPQQLRESIELAERTLADGLVVKIDSELGLFTQNGIEGKRSWIRDFQWQPLLDDEVFDVNPDEWKDFTSNIVSEGTRQDIIMAMHLPHWKPGLPNQDGNMVLANIKTGDIRRLPIPVGGLQGSFSQDLSFAYLSSLDVSAGSMRILEVEIESGTLRALGGPELESGFTLFPSLSPAGRTLAVLHKAPENSGNLESEVHLIDIESGTSRRIGEPLDTGAVSWFPSGDALLVNRRESIDMNKPSIGHLYRMGLDGQLTKIIDGNSAVIFEQSARILFCENGKKFWKTCNFEGGDVRVFGDGFGSFAFPAPSQDGKRLIMMKFDPRVGPMPHIIDVETATATRLNMAAGLWSNVSWR